MALAHGARDLHGETFVDQQFTQRRAAPRLPIGVVAFVSFDQRAHFAATGGGRVANDVREFVCEPEWDQFGVEPQPLRFRVGDTGEVFEADECDATPAQDEFTRIRRTDTDHQHHIIGHVGFEQRLHLALGLRRKCDDVHASEQRTQVVAIGVDRGANHFVEMGPGRLKDIVVPVGSEERAMALKVLAICRVAISGIENGEKIRKEIDQHQRP